MRLNLKGLYGMKYIISAIIACVIVSAAYGADIQTALNDIKSADSNKKVAAIGILAVSRTAEAEEALIAHLEEERNSHLKTKIIEALAMYRSARAANALVSALGDPSPQVRQSAVIGLKKFGGRDDIAEAIAGTLYVEKELSVKMSAVNTLKQYKSEKAVSALGAVIKNEKDPGLRKAAVRALGKIGNSGAKKELNKHKNIADKAVKAEVDKALKGVTK